MCNAWNHWPGCDCGFGGNNYLGFTGIGDNNYIKNKIFDSFVNPNAKCPVCRASVFYYESEDGGRVFFDELGPPWPKHGCTDNGIQPKKNDYTGSFNSNWLKKGYFPVLRPIVSKTANNDYFMFSGIVLRTTSFDFASKYLVKNINEDLSKAIVFVKFLDEDQIKISYYNSVNNQSGETIGYGKETAKELGLIQFFPISSGDVFDVELKLYVPQDYSIVVHPISRSSESTLLISVKDLKKQNQKSFLELIEKKSIITVKAISTMNQIILKEV